MSLRIIRAASSAEQSDDLHIARLLVLLRKATGKNGKKPVTGIMKLAKMDFLLRYPNCLARILKDTNGDVAAAKIEPFEQNTIESKMIRFRYGPWDGRYRRWIGIMVAKGMATTYLKGKAVCVTLTESGVRVGSELSTLPEFSDIDRRSKLIVETVGGMTATNLKDFIYKEFPELINMRWGQEIEL